MIPATPAREYFLRLIFIAGKRGGQDRQLTRLSYPMGDSTTQEFRSAQLKWLPTLFELRPPLRSLFGVGEEEHHRFCDGYGVRRLLCPSQNHRLVASRLGGTYQSKPPLWEISLLVLAQKNGRARGNRKPVQAKLSEPGTLKRLRCSVVLNLHNHATAITSKIRKNAGGVGGQWDMNCPSSRHKGGTRGQVLTTRTGPIRQQKSDDAQMLVLYILNNRMWRSLPFR